MSKKKKKKQKLFIELTDLEQCSGEVVVLDTETTGLSWLKHSIIGLGVHCPAKGITGYIPSLTDWERDNLKGAVKYYLGPETAIIAHNAKFDLHFLDADPEELGWDVIDTAVMVHLLDSRYKKSAVATEQRFLGTNRKAEHKDKHGRTKIWDWPLKDVARYCIDDVLIEYEFAKVLRPLLEDHGLWRLFEKEMEYLKLVWGIERRGILLDQEFVISAAQRLGETLEVMEQALWDAVGYEFNWRSHQQLSKAIYEDMGIPHPVNPFPNSRFADRGKYNSTNTSTFLLMEKVHHPLGELISAIREAHKLQGTMKRWLVNLGFDGHLHPVFKMTGTRTGRLSSGDAKAGMENFQNVASEFRNRFTQSMFSGDTHRDEEYNLRNAFMVSNPDMRFVAVDWRQMEMRMFGILSEDPVMLKALNEGRDVHADIAMTIWNTRDKVQREWAKTISFGLIYGMTTGSLQLKLNMTRQEAEKVTEDYWGAFPNIRPWLFGMADEARQNGFIRYWSGRLWKEESEKWFYKAANAAIQGGCADILSVAAIRTHQWLREQGPEFNIVNLIHDEIMIEVPKRAVKKTVKNISKIMEVPDLFGSRWLTDAKVGTTYGNMEKWDG